ncbi:lumican [Denticeps clupeoides]|uniref:LRRNT domain-containing protein n=1 Tax=Denticeps clupeoides TaxID=299321 RepID=A0AAY4EF06_9TELE|nr:lumican-like [Denticeps clupeoides]XP_028853353.1 lumican-like [Denticeps clupeoides]
MDIRPLLLLVAACESVVAYTVDQDYGGVPLWINRLLGEPSVLSLRGRLDPRWLRAVNTQSCPLECECPIQWPTAIYCDSRSLVQMPSGLPSRTQYLFLQGNGITGFAPEAFANATRLRWLFLDRNQLLRLDGGLLSNLTYLVHIFMNHNNLTEVPAGLPSGLRQLRLAYNNIEKISPGAFQNLHNLTLLLLQGNRFKTIGENSFQGLLALKMLDLSHNFLKTFPRHLPSAVEQLYLSNNSLAGMERDSLQGFSNLRYLRLGHNQLQDNGMDPGAFNLTSLVELDLSYNHLTQIPVVTTSLRYLYLEANLIHKFTVSSFCRTVGPDSYSRIRILRLEGNKIAAHQLPTDWVMCLRVLHQIFI